MYGDPKWKISRNFKTWESAVWKCNANTRFIAGIKNVIFTRVTNDEKWNVTLNNKSWHMKNLLVLCPQHHTCWVYEELISPVSLGQPPELMRNYDDSQSCSTMSMKIQQHILNLFFLAAWSFSVLFTVSQEGASVSHIQLFLWQNSHVLIQDSGTRPVY